MLGVSSRWRGRIVNTLLLCLRVVGYLICEVLNRSTKPLFQRDFWLPVQQGTRFGNIGAAFQSLVGGNITLYTTLCEQARKESFEMLLKHADELGANAIVGVRYDATEISGGITEVICYGTAAIVKK